MFTGVLQTVKGENFEPYFTGKGKSKVLNLTTQTITTDLQKSLKKLPLF